MNKRLLIDKFHLLTYAMTIVGWALLIYALVVFDNARPEMTTVVTNYFGIDIRQNWLGDVYDKLRFLLWFCAVSSFLTLIFNYILNVTYKERISMAILLLFVVSVAAISLLLILNPTTI